jgi:hypothetical protein
MNKAELNTQLDFVEQTLTDKGVVFDKANRSGTNAELENELARLEELLSDDDDQDGESGDSNQDATKGGDQAREYFLKERGEKTDIAKIKVQIKKGLNVETKRLGGEKRVLSGGQPYLLPADFAEELLDGGHADEVEDEEDDA